MRIISMPHPKRATYAAKYEDQNFKYAFVVPNLCLLRHFLDDRSTHISGYSNQKQIGLLGDSGTAHPENHRTSIDSMALAKSGDHY